LSGRHTLARVPLQPLTEGVSSEADLHDRVALVTGAGRGIGRAIAETLARAGADVAALDLAAPTETCAALEALGVRSLPLIANVAQRTDVEHAVERTVAILGRLDILVNNAGIVERTTLETLDDTTFEREIGVIARGTYLCTQAAFPHMKRQGGGKIVNISSISGKLGGAVLARPGTPAERTSRSGPAYALAKGGVIAFTKWVAKDGGPHGIHANAVCPGPVDSEMTRGFDYNVADMPIPRMGTPGDVALCVLFLASQMSNFVTGQTVNVDGGILMD